MINIIKHGFFILTSIYNVAGFNILPYNNVSTTEIDFYFCDSVHPILEVTTKEVIEQINTYELFKIKLNEETKIEHKFNYKNSICNENLDNNIYSEYGFCTHYSPFFNETDITISNTILGIDTNLYNVVLHEFIHAIGLDHGTNKGMMNYTIQLTENNGIIKDSTKLYISIDDYIGIKYLYDKLENDKERFVNTCDKNKIIEYINNCV